MLAGQMKGLVVTAMKDHTDVTPADLSNLTAAVLAGGLGTRLRPVVADRQKVLADVGGRAFLAHLLDHLLNFNIRHVVLCTGYLGEQVREIFGDTYGPMLLEYTQEPSPLGTAGALRSALCLIKTETVLVMNGDSFCVADLNAFWAWHCARKAVASVLLSRSSDTRRYGRVQVDESGAVLSFDEKNNQSSPGWINAGVYLLKRDLLLEIPDSGPVSLEREIFPAWIGRGLHGFQGGDRLLDIGTPQAYARAEGFFSCSSTA